MTATEQKELPMFQHAPDDPNVQWLENLLRGAQCWMSARDICLTNGGRTRDREVRALASASANIISGQNGYKHIAHATAEEIHHASSWLVSQGKKMIKRGIAIQRNGHRRLG